LNLPRVTKVKGSAMKNIKVNNKINLYIVLFARNNSKNLPRVTKVKGPAMKNIKVLI
ncbi:hypothetical protein EWB00_003893, partial [Schistosoma japonicum]